MGKHYDINLKNKVVNDYFSNEGGVIYLGKKYNISSNTIQHWINKQKIQGNQINDIDNLRGRSKEENIDCILHHIQSLSLQLSFDIHMYLLIY